MTIGPAGTIVGEEYWELTPVIAPALELWKSFEADQAYDPGLQAGMKR